MVRISPDGNVAVGYNKDYQLFWKNLSTGSEKHLSNYEGVDFKIVNVAAPFDLSYDVNIVSFSTSYEPLKSSLAWLTSNVVLDVMHNKFTKIPVAYDSSNYNVASLSYDGKIIGQSVVCMVCADPASYVSYGFTDGYSQSAIGDHHKSSYNGVYTSGFGRYIFNLPFNNAPLYKFDVVTKTEVRLKYVVSGREWDVISNAGYSSSADGRFIVLTSFYRMFGDDGKEDVDAFVYDSENKIIQIINRSDVNNPADFSNTHIKISGDGRYILFWSSGEGKTVPMIMKNPLMDDAEFCKAY